jgi:hypothetical protein
MSQGEILTGGCGLFNGRYSWLSGHFIRYFLRQHFLIKPINSNFAGNLKSYEFKHNPDQECPDGEPGQYYRR